MQELTVRSNILRAIFQTAPGQFKFRQAIWALWFVIMVGISIVMAYLAIMGMQIVTLIGWLVLLACAVTTLWKPRWGLYILVFFSLISDKILTFWFPFVKNFSSVESILYLNDRLIFSPFELFLVMTYFSWFAGAIANRRLRIQKNEQLWALLVFVLFMLIGLVYGLARGGNSNVALWEVRSMVYLPAVFLLANNLITRREHVGVVMWLLMSSLCIKGITGVIYVATKLQWDISRVQEITEHSVAIQFNSFLVYLLGVWIFKDTPARRFLLPLMGLPVLFSLVATQRRAAYLVLILAMILVAYVLYREKRVIFWTIAPVVTLIFLGYMAAFWNNQGPLGMPVRALKSQLLPGQASLRDQASDVYRMMENYNSLATIKRVPLTGTGFGHPFDMPIQLPDISFFIWYRYITHNSILWIWNNTGIGGFFALLMLIGVSISTGARAIFNITEPSLRSAVFAATMYILMHFIYAYFDMSWDTQNMIYVGTMMGLIACAGGIAAQPVKTHAPRWHWQPNSRGIELPGVRDHME